MSQTTMAAVAIALVLGMLGFGLWYSWRHPREIVATGTVVVQSGRVGGSATTLKTRDVAINKVVFKEVELPNGTWIDCAGDCAAAARDAGEGFWDKQARERR